MATAGATTAKGAGKGGGALTANSTALRGNAPAGPGEVAAGAFLAGSFLGATGAGAASSRSDALAASGAESGAWTASGGGLGE